MYRNEEEDIRYMDKILSGAILNDPVITEEYKQRQIAKIARKYITIVRTQKHNLMVLKDNLKALEEHLKGVIKELKEYKAKDDWEEVDESNEFHYKNKFYNKERS